MTTLTNARGEVVDLTTGEVVGRTEGAPTAVEPRAATAPDIQTEGGDRVKGALKNLSWGFNSALFALPDAATRGIGKALGMNDQEVFTLGNFFNKGQAAPRNAEERYSRAIGEGIGGTMPFTGALAYVARTRPMVTTAVRGTDSVVKGIANDAIKFVQQSPRLAAAMDIAFGAGFETIRQAVKENVSDDNPNKQLYEQLLPTAAFVGLPMALNIMPSAMVGKFVGNKLKSATSGLRELDEEALAGIPKYWNIPGVKLIPKVLLGNAEKKLATVFGDIKNSPEAQAALRELETVMQDPRFAEAGFSLDFTQKTMSPALVERQNAILEQLGPAELKLYRERQNENQKKFDTLISGIAPEAQKPVIEAFQAAQAERQSFFDSLLQGQKNLTDQELLSISERLGPQNMDMINNELRGALQGAMEFDYDMRKNVLNRMGLRQGTLPDGLPAPTRQDGKSLFPARDMEDMATALIKKYTPERPSLRNPVPEPIALLQRFVETQQAARMRMEKKMVTQLTDQAIEEQITASGLPKDIEEAVRSSITALMQGKGGKGTKRRANIAETAKIDSSGNVSLPTGIPGKTISFNPTQIQEDAARIANENTGININLPEALDYLASAARFRNDSLSSYNAAMSKGATRLTDAQRYVDRGTAVYNDIEKLIVENVPKIRAEYEGMKNILSDYRSGFEQTLPLIMAQRKGRGEEFLLGNEQLLQKAFSNAANLRQLQVSLGGTPQFDELLLRGTVDWLRNKNVLAADGTVDPKKIRAALDKNKNIVEALPDTIQAKLQDEVALADEYVKRMGELNDRRTLAKNDELDQILKKVSRPDADPRNTLVKAVEDPATMRVLVDELGKDPERLAALRRSVFDMAGEGALQGGALSSFLTKNEKSLAVLFKDTKHLEDLKKLADVQRRINAFKVVGDVPSFESMDQSLKRLFGIGIGAASTTYRSTAEGRLSPTTALISFLVRATGNVENTLYNNIFRRAMEDPKFAADLTSMSTAQQAQKVAAGLEKLGIYRSMLFKNLGRAGALEAGQAAMSGQTAPIEGMQEKPVVPRGPSAREMLRNLPPAPPTVGYSSSMGPAPAMRLPTQPPRPTGNAGLSNMQMMYPAMFPNDPISGILEQRRRQVEQGQQMQPPQLPPQ